MVLFLIWEENINLTTDNLTNTDDNFAVLLP